MFTKAYEKIKKFIKENYKSIIVLIVILFLFTFELSYVIYTPGGIINLEKRVNIEGEYQADGSLNMSYVSLVKGTIPMILLSFVIPNWDLISTDEVTVDNESIDELLELEKLYMDSSIDNATILAYQEAGKKLKIIRDVNNIVFIADEAKTDLKVYDELISADGVNINYVEDLKKVINEKNAGDTILLKVIRNGEEKECSAKIYDSADGLKIGIAFLTTYEYETDPKIDIKTKASESGSSGGLMLSLAIYNALVEEDITGGKIIVGTGTIDTLGNVGEIDGVKYKLLGAVKNKADIFLCPVSNYEEALKVKEKFDLDIEIFGVNTFKEALEVLKDSR